jgi:hypothetical protein
MNKSSFVPSRPEKALDIQVSEGEWLKSAIGCVSEARMREESDELHHRRHEMRLND